MQDTFFIKNLVGKLPEDKIVSKVKMAHEGGIDGSRGWEYSWDEEKSKKIVMRTHTTCLSTRKLRELKESGELPAKYFSIGKAFRNETVDWSHGFEFNQSEGIVIDENANFRQLLGYLKQFARKMGFEKVRFRPAYFPYTEPSLEGDVWNEKKQKWVEVFAAGIFRPEVTEPLLGKPIPVLAWGPGFDRMIMEFYKITDLREIYKNDINKLREMKFWRKN
jgi:phenylalanyl-tRNA synthetase alpha chain